MLYEQLIQLASKIVQDIGDAKDADTETKHDDLEGLKEDIDNVIRRLESEE